MSKEYSRRSFVSISGSLLFGSTTLFFACNSKKPDEKNEKAKPISTDPCNDFSGVSDAELKKRAQLGYVKKSPNTESRCNNCQLWLPRKDNQVCGSCQLFKGPVLAEAHCTYWAPQIKQEEA